MIRFTTADRRRRLGRRHRLDGACPATGPEEAADAVVALHSSDPVTVFLSVLARSPEASIDSVEQALYRDRSLLRVHGMRRTLWVTGRETAVDIVSACRSRLLAADRKRFIRVLEESGIAGDGAGEAWLAAATEELVEHLTPLGMSDTRSIGRALPHLAGGYEAAPGKRYSTMIAAHSRILLYLGFDGRIIRADPLGSWIASQYRWATIESWLGQPAEEWATVDEHIARSRVVARYLAAFGPVTDTDLSWWTGWPKRDVVSAMEPLAPIEVDLDGIRGWTLEEDAEPAEAAEAGWVAVLPALDPTTMGWKQRDWYLDPALVNDMFDRNGNVGPTIWADGRVVGGWAQRDDGELAHRLLVDIGADGEAAVETELERLAHRIGETRFKIRFKTPLNEELRS